MTATSPPDVELEVMKNQPYRLPRPGADHPPTISLHIIPAGVVWTCQVDGLETTNVDDGSGVAVASVVNVTNCST